MDSLILLLQLGLYAFLFLCIIIWGIAHLIMGTIGLLGFSVVLFFAYLMWCLLVSAWREYQKEINK